MWILLLMGKDMVGLIRTYEKNFLLVLGIGVAVLVLAFFLLRWKFREPLRRYFEKYRKLLNRKILLRVVGVSCSTCCNTCSPPPCMPCRRS